MRTLAVFFLTVIPGVAPLAAQHGRYLNDSRNPAIGDPAAIAAALPQVSDTFVGVTGPLKLDQDGQRVDQPYVIATVDDGRIVPQ